jgi:predicted RNA-binding protein with PUA-like domain
LGTPRQCGFGLRIISKPNPTRARRLADIRLRWSFDFQNASRALQFLPRQLRPTLFVDAGVDAFTRRRLSIAWRMPVHYWLVKQEPAEFSWDALVAETKTAWTGVRNFQARNNLRQMRCGDLVLFYHSGDEKRVVGIAKVVREAYPDPTATEGDWSCVDLAPLKPLEDALPLNAIKADNQLRELPLVRQGRLSVMGVAREHFTRILELSKTTI